MMNEDEARETTKPLGNVDPLPTREELSRTSRVHVAEPVWGAQVGKIDLPIHPPSACEGEGCPFHHPSDHHMVNWEKNVRLDKAALVERICEHGVGHPDPDSLDFFKRTRGEREASALGVHGCDGCCAP